jgi:hypothetical protein
VLHIPPVLVLVARWLFYGGNAILARHVPAGVLQCAILLKNLAYSRYQRLQIKSTVTLPGEDGQYVRCKADEQCARLFQLDEEFSKRAVGSTDVQEN